MIEAFGLWELVERRAAMSGDRLLVIDERGDSLTFGQLRLRAERAAAGLSALGVGEETHVSWQLPSWIESIVLVAALARLATVQNPLLPLYREREVRFITRQTGAQLLIVPSVWRGFDYAEMARKVVDELDGCELLVCDRKLPQGDPSTLSPPPTPLPGPEAAPVRWIFYTSGTTADPKGALHTDATIRAGGVAAATRTGSNDPDGRAAFVFPFTHIGGIQGLMRALVNGSSGVVVEIFDPVDTMEVLSREGITELGGATPIMLAALAAQRRQPERRLFPKLRVCPAGGAPIPEALHDEVRRELGGAGVVSGYGLTEFPVMTMNAIDDSDDKLAPTEGRPSPGVDVRVVTAQGRLAQPGEEGEIRAVGPQLFKGYLDPELDREAFDENGYFRTGDLGFLDEDGYIVITGRIKDIIIRKGENISAKEVEDVLYTHPKVTDVAVIGLPDRERGERCCAVVQVGDPTDPLSLDEMARFCRERGLMPQKIPEQLEVLTEIPRNPVGKVMKHVLRERYGSTPRGAP